MQSTKKTTTILVITMLMLSILVTVLPVNAAAPSVSLSAGTGKVGDTITVTVTGTTPGGLVKLYWDSIKDWDGKAGYLTEAYAVGTTATIKIKIPATVIGNHYVIAKDVESGLTSSAIFTVEPSIKLTPDKVIAGDTISVSGTGFVGGTSAIVLYGVTTTTVTAEAVGTGDGTRKSWSLANKPVESISEIRVAGVATTAYTLDYVNGIITFDTAPASGAAIEADYKYYDTTTKVVTSTSDVGSFTASLKVPTGATPGTYTIRGLDGEGNYADATLTVVTCIITLSPNKGYVSSTVTVTGRGFTADKKADIRWYMDGAYITIVDDYPIDSSGAFTTTFTVPLVPDPVAPGTAYTVKAIDNAGTPKEASATFTVTAPAKISLSPSSGKVGATVTITGSWFTENKKVTFKFGNTILTTSPSVVYTDSVGAFTVIFTVPSVDVGSYVVNATDEKGVSATATFKVIVLVIEISTRATEYMQGDTVSIYASCSEAQTGVKLKIVDPANSVFWTATVDVNTKVGDWYVLSSYVTVLLPSDASLGNWNFTASDSGGKILDTNLLKVVQRFTTSTIITEIDKMEEDLAKVMTKLDALTKIQSDLATITSQLAALTELKNSITDMKSTLAGLSSQLTAIEGYAQAASTSAASAISAAQAAATAAAGAKTSADSVASTASTIQISVYLCIVVALITAVAAIFAVITLQRKVA